MDQKMSLKRRISTPPPRHSVVLLDDTKPKETFIGSKNNIGSTAVGDLFVDPLRLDRENKELRLELEDIKQRLRRYEQDANLRKNTPIRATHSTKRSPPPALPTFRHETLSQTTPRSMNTEPLLAPLLGLHQRRHPGEEEDPRRQKIKGIVKHRDSNDFDDVESPRPVRYTEGGTASNGFLLENSSDVGVLLNTNHHVEGGDAYDDNVGFGSMILDRAGWLVGLLVLQSMSSFIIQRNETMLQKHLVIVRFLTMLVGAGGNAGNQASVRGAFKHCFPTCASAS